MPASSHPAQSGQDSATPFGASAKRETAPPREQISLGADWGRTHGFCSLTGPYPLPPGG